MRRRRARGWPPRCVGGDLYGDHHCDQAHVRLAQAWARRVASALPAMERSAGGGKFPRLDAGRFVRRLLLQRVRVAPWRGAEECTRGDIGHRDEMARPCLRELQIAAGDAHCLTTRSDSDRPCLRRGRALGGTTAWVREVGADVKVRETGNLHTWDPWKLRETAH